MKGRYQILHPAITLGLIAVSTSALTQDKIATITRVEMEQLTGQPWKCNDHALSWMNEAIERIRTIHVGSTRVDLTRVFRPSGSGGGSRQRFDYPENRDNALFYVEVEFDRDRNKLTTNPDEDRITGISGPFISTVRLLQDSQARATWLDDTLQRIQTIKPGMTRKQLLEVFRSQGGISTDLQETYVSRDCPFFQAEVKFEPVGRPARDPEGRVTLIKAEQDRIIHISTPFLAREHAD